MIRIDSDVEDLIEGIINDLIGEVQHMDSSLHLNERYIHHLFTHMIQSRGILVSLDETDCSNTYLHPEWATSIEHERKGAKYRCNNDESDGKKGKYVKDNDKGHSGFVDFVIKTRDNSKYAIEFKMSKSLNREGIVFDFMKLIDNDNSFKKSYSLIVYYGHSEKSSHFDEKHLTINDCLEEAKNRVHNHDTRYHFYAIEYLNANQVFQYEAETDGLFTQK